MKKRNNSFRFSGVPPSWISSKSASPSWIARALSVRLAISRASRSNRYKFSFDLRLLDLESFQLPGKLVRDSALGDEPHDIGNLLENGRQGPLPRFPLFLDDRHLVFRTIAWFLEDLRHEGFIACHHPQALGEENFQGLIAHPFGLHPSAPLRVDVHV